MGTLHLVDPELVPFAEQAPSFELSDDVLAAVRAYQWPAPPLAENVIASSTVESRIVPGPDGDPDVQVLVYIPTNATGPLGCIFHIHGGGYVVGSVHMMDSVLRQFVHDLGCAIVTVDYRSAPETVFPGAVEDCYAALRWLYAEAAALGIDPEKIGVMGESAGGGLAAAFGLLVRDRAEYRAAFQLLSCPMLDDRTCLSNRPNPYTGEFVWTRQNNHYGWRALLGQEPGSPDVSPYAAAARATDLAGLPPTFINVGALDLFVDEDIEYAHRLIRAGVPTELHVYPGVFHGADYMDSAISRRAAADRIVWLRNVLKGQ
jgi:acetyl esterase/lipase